jgi:hypothetical protein
MVLDGNIDASLFAGWTALAPAFSGVVSPLSFYE